MPDIATGSASSTEVDADTLGGCISGAIDLCSAYFSHNHTTPTEALKFLGDTISLLIERSVIPEAMPAQGTQARSTAMPATAAQAAPERPVVTAAPAAAKTGRRGRSAAAAIGRTEIRTAESDGVKPAVPIDKSVTPEAIICLNDGKKLKTLKKHLRAAYNMTPEEYRAYWNLPKDYPLVAPEYTAYRRDLAQKGNLGSRRLGTGSKSENASH